MSNLPRSGPVTAQTYTWTGDVNANWINGVPALSLTDTTLLFDANSDQNLAATNDITSLSIFRLRIVNPSGPVTVSARLPVRPPAH